MQSIKNCFKWYTQVILHLISNSVLLFPVPVNYFNLLVGVFSKIFCCLSLLISIFLKLIKNVYKIHMVEKISRFRWNLSFSSLSPRLFVANSTTMLKKTLKTSKLTMGIFSVVWKSNPNTNWELFCEKTVEYFALFSLSQWISSLVSLVFLYWITGRYYNRLLANKGGWLDVKTRIWLIVIDLANNFALGIYCMYYRETVLGKLMVLCPIAISPAIFVLELICVHLYKSYINRTGLFKE
jgi:hypothetical protein